VSTPDQRVHDAIRDRRPVDLLLATRDLRCVVVALFSVDGLLIEANRGFWELGLVSSDPERAPDVRDAFLTPRFAEFCARKPDSDHSVYEGLLTLGNRSARNFSVRGRIEAHGSQLWLVAEHDVAEHQRLTETVLALNERLIGQQRDLLRARRELEAERTASKPQGSELARLAQRLTISEEAKDYRDLHADASRRLGRLTPREREVLERLAAGLTHRRIAEELGISEPSRPIATTSYAKAKRAPWPS
jgi:hypothetical protein